MVNELSIRAKRIDAISESFSKSLNVVSGVWLFSITVLILYDVIGREVFASPFHGTNEIVSNSVLSILMLQLPLTIINRSSLRTTILYGKMGTRGKGITEATSYLLAGLVFLGIAYGSWENMIESWDILELEGSGIVEIPVYPIRTLVVFIGFIGAFVCSLMVYKSLKIPESYE
ncbi:MAG TPA: TRAP transporter small permease [Rhodospirillales bacterium]|jgi:TRAP-type C4-dicarboxylate transport system permease small subunit|nr:TRAP transporter small permease [Rhodospirillales bacterium]HIL77089.1 TRAP transporter small permease [Rhodospirillales bacterium]